MNQIIDTLINLDTDHYLSTHKDVQTATRSMSDIDRKLWVLTHFVKHGYLENRKYQLKTQSLKKSNVVEEKRKTPLPVNETKPITKEKHVSHSTHVPPITLDDVGDARSKPVHKSTGKNKSKTDKDHSSDDDEQDVQTLIRKFRQKHSKEVGGARDKSVNDDPRIKKNFFWEISQ